MELLFLYFRRCSILSEMHFSSKFKTGVMDDSILEKMDPKVRSLTEKITTLFPVMGPASLERFIRLSIQLSSQSSDIDFNQDVKKDLHIKLCKALTDLEYDLTNENTNKKP